MKIGRIIIASLTVPLLFTAVAMAQSTPPTSTNPSDYSKDVQDGQLQLKNDTDAADQAKKIKANETIQGDVDNDDVDVDEVVEVDEADVSDSQLSESSDKSDSSATDSKDTKSDAKSSDTSDKSDKTSTSETSNKSSEGTN